MTGTQASLRDKFRGVLAGRAERLLELVRGLGDSPAHAQERRDALGELHTLKGEAKMLGWSQLATLAHALEERLAVPQPDIDEAVAVVDAMLLSLSFGTADAEAESLLGTALEALLGPGAPNAPLLLDSASLGSAKKDEAAPLGESAERTGASPLPDRKRWVHVEADTVDALGEALATFSTEFARFVASGDSAQGAPGGSGSRAGFSREQADEADRLRAALSNILLWSLELRLTPVQPIFARLASHARVLAKQKGKDLDVVVQSGGSRVEREVIERLGEPLLHLVSNAVDHGIEAPLERGSKSSRATLELSAKSEGALVVLRIRDDGRGLDPAKLRKRAAEEGRLAPDASEQEALNVIFEAGFSTKDRADEVSGRGVGLDVVKRQTEAMGVRLSVESEVGKGTTFVLGIPAALSQENLLVLRVEETLYGLPGHLVAAVLEDGMLSEGERTFRFQDVTLPLRSLATTLGFARGAPERRVVVVDLGQKRFALRCANVLGHFELIRRPAGRHLGRTSGVSASAQTERGELVLVLDENHLKQRLMQVQNSIAAPPRIEAPTKRRVLVVDDSIVVRNLLQAMLISTGFEVKTAENGHAALPYLEGFRPGLVLSDIEMPGMGGFELLRQIRARDPLLPVVLVTARSSEEDRRKAVELGANAYVTKGEFERESLVSTVLRLYRERS